MKSFLVPLFDYHVLAFVLATFTNFPQDFHVTLCEYQRVGACKAKLDWVVEGIGPGFARLKATAVLFFDGCLRISPSSH